MSVPGLLIGLFGLIAFGVGVVSIPGLIALGVVPNALLSFAHSALLHAAAAHFEAMDEARFDVDAAAPTASPLAA